MFVTVGVTLGVYVGDGSSVFVAVTTLVEVGSVVREGVSVNIIGVGDGVAVGWAHARMANSKTIYAIRSFFMVSSSLTQIEPTWSIQNQQYRPQMQLVKVDILLGPSNHLLHL